MIAEANSLDTSENNDVSSQLAEISQLKDLMTAVRKKPDNNSPDANTQGPSKQPKFGLDIVAGITDKNEWSI